MRCGSHRTGPARIGHPASPKGGRTMHVPTPAGAALARSSKRARRRLSAAAIAAIATSLVLPAGSAGAEPGYYGVGPMPVPAGVSRMGGAYTAVSCATPTQCTAVGAGDGSGPVFAVTGTLEGWGRPTRLSLPAGASARGAVAPQLQGISCPSVRTCTAVGIVMLAGGAVRPLVLTESSGVWHAPTPVGVPAGARAGRSEDAWLTSVDCVAVGSCVAVGTYVGTDGLPHGLVETQSHGSTFASGELPDILGLSIADQAFAVSVSCIDPSTCTAVAQQVIGDAVEVNGDTWTESAGEWRRPDQLYSPQGSPSLFTPSSIACPDASTCVVVGVLVTHTGVEPGYDVETSGFWAPTAALPFPLLAPMAGGGGLSGISCDTSSACVAVGSFVAPPRSGLDVAGAATWSAGAWSSIGYVRGVSAPGRRTNISEFAGASCASTTACTAVGAAALVGSNGPGPISPFSAELQPDRIVERPSAPSEVVVKGVVGGADVRWLPPVDDGGAPVRTFTAAVLQRRLYCTTASDRCAIRGLPNGRRFRVDVIDQTDYGVSKSVTTTVVSGRPPTAPGGLHTAIVSGSLMITWRPSSSPVGEPVHYRLSVRGPHHLSRRFMTAGSSLELRAVASGIYTVAIVAENASGASSRRVVRTVARRTARSTDAA